MSVRRTVRPLRRLQTPAEEVLWAELRGHRLGGLKFRRQYPIGKFVADFYCASARLVVEVDGAVHRKPDQADYDRDRDELFATLDLTVLRVSNDDVLFRLAETLDKIRAAARH